MRKLFWLMLLANVFLFAAMQRGWFGWGEQVSLARPALHENKIRMLDIPRGTPAARSSKPDPVEDSLAASSPAATKPAKLACLEWGGFSGLGLTRVLAALPDLRLENKITQHQVEHDIGHWVYMPPLKNKAAVNRKIRELKALGINEYFVVKSSDRWRNAISLGVFQTQEAAQHFFDQLRTKGVRTAKVGKRASKFTVTQFRFSEVGVLAEAKLTTMQKDFPGSELKRVPCALTR